jgi:anti-sigma regulatory factor (Ser/Thr protein kinase)
VYPDRAAALSALTATTPRWVHGRMDADPIGVSWARNLVGEACLGWGLPHLLGPARRVTSELAQNAVEHAASPFDVTIAATARYLRIGVQDRTVSPPCLLHDLSPDPHAPLADRGCGLRIVTDTASRWGTTPLADGKIVWALLPVDPVPAGPIARVGTPAVRRHPRGASGKPVTYPQGMRRSVAPMTYP